MACNQHASSVTATWIVARVHSYANQVLVTDPVAFSFGGGLYFNRGQSLLLSFPLLDELECLAALLEPFLGRSLAGLELDAFLC